MTPDAPLIDPTTEQLADQLDAAAESSGRDWGEVLTALQARREGVVTVDAGVPFGVCWWTDRLGRRHWAVHPNPERPLADELTRVGDASLRWNTIRHPLEWIAPPLSCGWRERGGRREFVVICRCGVVGAPEAVAWMGPTCGPCFDREQEGMPTVGAPPGRWEVGLCSGFTVAAGGRLVGWFDEDDGRSILGSDPPWVESWWRGGGPPGQLVAVSADGSRYALAFDDQLEIGDAGTGEIMHTGATNHWLTGITLAGPGGGCVYATGYLGTQTNPRAGTHVLFGWKTRPGGVLHEQPFDWWYCRAPRGPGLAASRDGRTVLIERRMNLEARRSADGSLVASLRLPPREAVRALLLLADRAVVASLDGPPRLVRWAATANFVERFWAGDEPPLKHPQRITPTAVPLTRLAATPDGRSVFGLADGRVVRHDAGTLQLTASFQPARGYLGDGLAIVSEWLLTTVDDTLTVWPWRELFGVE